MLHNRLFYYLSAASLTIYALPIIFTIPLGLLIRKLLRKVGVDGWQVAGRKIWCSALVIVIFMILRFFIFMIVKFDEEKFIRTFGEAHSHNILGDCLTCYYFLEVIAIAVIIYVHVRNVYEDWGESKSAINQSQMRNSVINAHSTT